MANDPLEWLDDNTDWEYSNDPLSDNDEEDEEGGSGVLVKAEDESGLDDKETVANILSCVSDIDTTGEIVDIVVIINTSSDDQLFFTTFERNDLIMGCLETAKMNWFSTQRDFQSNEEEGGEEVC